MLCPENKDNYKYDPVRHLFFENYKISKNIKLSWGLESLKSPYMNGYKNIIIFFEEPNFLGSYDVDSFINNWDTKLTLCKYTSKNFNNKKIPNKKCINVFFPVDIKFIKSQLWDNYNYNMDTNIPYWKNINVLYSGHEHFQLVHDFKNIMKKYNGNNTIEMPTYLSKMDAYLHSKIAIVHNLLFFDNLPYKIGESIPEFKNKNIIPQLKSRLFESACSKCIILCFKDEFNLIEDYFTPGEDFIYFEDINKLDIIINEILNNYQKYAYIAKNAYNKFMNNYTLEHFCLKYLKE